MSVFEKVANIASIGSLVITIFLSILTYMIWRFNVRYLHKMLEEQLQKVMKDIFEQIDQIKHINNANFTIRYKDGYKNFLEKELSEIKEITTTLSKLKYRNIFSFFRSKH